PAPVAVIVTLFTFAGTTNDCGPGVENVVVSAAAELGATASARPSAAPASSPVLRRAFREPAKSTIAIVQPPVSICLSPWTRGSTGRRRRERSDAAGRLSA